MKQIASNMYGWMFTKKWKCLNVLNLIANYLLFSKISFFIITSTNLKQLFCLFSHLFPNFCRLFERDLFLTLRPPCCFCDTGLGVGFVVPAVHPDLTVAEVRLQRWVRRNTSVWCVGFMAVPPSDVTDGKDDDGRQDNGHTADGYGDCVISYWLLLRLTMGWS